MLVHHLEFFENSAELHGRYLERALISNTRRNFFATIGRSNLFLLLFLDGDIAKIANFLIFCDRCEVPKRNHRRRKFRVFGAKIPLVVNQSVQIQCKLARQIYFATVSSYILDGWNSLTEAIVAQAQEEHVETVA